MKERQERKNSVKRFLFVGESRSPLAQKNGYTWDNVPNISAHCSRKLFIALRNIDIEPREHDFANVWDDDGNPQEINAEGHVVVAMGLKVQKELIERGIPFIPIVHPAARGPWCRQEEYNKHIKESLKQVWKIAE